MQAIPTLIVDDSNMIIKIIKKALLTSKDKELHFQESSIYTASDGMEAFAMMGKGYPIKLIISDINMPNLNGDEFIEILKDTGKLEDLDVVFITSATNKQSNISRISDHILGVIYKPFKVDTFMGLLVKTKEEKLKKDIEIKRIKSEQTEQKKFIEKVCVKYLEKYAAQNEDPIDSLILDTFIDEIFGNDSIKEDDFAEIIHSIISNYIFEMEITHEIRNKNILCVLNFFKDNVVLATNRLGLLDTLETQKEYINSNELKLQEILDSLTKPISEMISLALVKVTEFPKLKSKLYAPYFDYIVAKFVEVDCQFVDENLAKLLIELKEVQDFTQLIYKYLNINFLSKEIPSVLKSTALKNEVIKRFTKSYQRLVLISDYYSGEIEEIIWKKAKDSSEIYKYLKKEMPKTLCNTQRFLFHNKKIKREELELYLPFEKQNVIVFSQDVHILKVFKDIIDVPFNKWDFLCYSRTSFLDAWIKGNIPNKIIIDYDFTSTSYENGIEFLRLITRKYPIFQNVINNKEVYIMAGNNQLSELHKYKNRYKFSVITKPLVYKNIEGTLLYS